MNDKDNPYTDIESREEFNLRQDLMEKIHSHNPLFTYVKLQLADTEELQRINNSIRPVLPALTATRFKSSEIDLAKFNTFSELELALIATPVHDYDVLVDIRYIMTIEGEVAESNSKDLKIPMSMYKVLSIITNNRLTNIMPEVTNMTHIAMSLISAAAAKSKTNEQVTTNSFIELLKTLKSKNTNTGYKKIIDIIILAVAGWVDKGEEPKNNDKGTHITS